MKKLFIISTLALSVSAFAQSSAEQTATATGTATNAGNSQSITFTSPPTTTSTITTNNTTNGTQTVNQNLSGTTTQNVNNSISGSTTQNINSSVSGTQTQNIVYSGTQTVKNVPSVNGPPLTSSNDTCMGSASGSANGPGFGISVGKTYTDDNCVLLKNSRELWNMGMKAAALARMCMDAINRDSLEMTGFECPQTTRARKGNLVQPGPNYNYAPPEYADPIIRSRLGLPPLTN